MCRGGSGVGVGRTSPRCRGLRKRLPDGKPRGLRQLCRAPCPPKRGARGACLCLSALRDELPFGRTLRLRHASAGTASGYGRGPEQVCRCQRRGSELQEAGAIRLLGIRLVPGSQGAFRSGSRRVSTSLPHRGCSGLPIQEGTHRFVDWPRPREASEKHVHPRRPRTDRDGKGQGKGCRRAAELADCGSTSATFTVSFSDHAAPLSSARMESRGVCRVAALER